MKIKEVFVVFGVAKFKVGKKNYSKVSKMVLKSWPLNFYKSVIALNQSCPHPVLVIWSAYYYCYYYHYYYYYYYFADLPHECAHMYINFGSIKTFCDSPLRV